MQRRAKRSAKLCSLHSYCSIQRGHLLWVNYALPARLTWHASADAARGGRPVWHGYCFFRRSSNTSKCVQPNKLNPGPLRADLLALAQGRHETGPRTWRTRRRGRRTPCLA